MKVLVPFFVFLFIASASFGQFVDNKRSALVVKRTATWCNPCGTWGWDLWQNLAADSDLPPHVAIQVHDSPSSQLHTPSATDMTSFFEASTGVPSFYIGSTNQTQTNQGSISSSATLTRLKALVNYYGNLDAEINVGYDATLSGDVIDINAKVKAFDDINGEYYLSVYVLEKDVVNYQNGQGNDAVHKLILRDAITPDGYGELIHNGAISAGTDFDFSYSYTVPQGFNAENVRLAMVVWKKDGSTYFQESAYSVKETLTSSTKQAFEEKAALEVFTIGNSISYNFAPKQGGDLRVDLVNVNGQVVQPLFFGSVDQQLQRTFSVNDVIPGLYFVRSNFGGTIKTETVRF